MEVGQREKPGVGEVEGAKDKPPRFPMVSKSPQGPALPDIKVDYVARAKPACSISAGPDREVHC